VVSAVERDRRGLADRCGATHVQLVVDVDREPAVAPGLPPTSSELNAAGAAPVPLITADPVSMQTEAPVPGIPELQFPFVSQSPPSLPACVAQTGLSRRRYGEQAEKEKDNGEKRDTGRIIDGHSGMVVGPVVGT